MFILTPLRLQDRAAVNNYLRQYPPEISEHTFTNLYAWSTGRPVWYALCKETLVFFVNKNEESESEKIMFGPPIGPASTMEIIHDLNGSVSGLSRFPASRIDDLVQSGFTCLEDEGNADYVYTVSDLANLSGRRFSSKRNKVKRCLNRYDCQYEPITTESIVKECLDLQTRWCTDRDCALNLSLCSEYVAIEEAFAHFFDFSLLGGVIRVDGIVQAYAIGERLNEETAVCHFEKAMPGIDGLGQLINQWFARFSLTDFSYVNREQDLGIPGLRQAKQSYHPHHLVKKYILTR